MGSTRWSDDHYRDRAELRRRTGKDAFEHDHAVRTGGRRPSRPPEDESARREGPRVARQ